MTATTELPTLANLTVIPPVYFLLGTSVAVLFLCLSLLLWRRSSSKGSKKASDHSRRKPVTEETPEDDEPADETRKKVTILFGTQTGTTEGFAKVSCSCTELFDNLDLYISWELSTCLDRTSLPLELSCHIAMATADHNATMHKELYMCFSSVNTSENQHAPRDNFDFSMISRHSCSLWELWNMKWIWILAAFNDAIFVVSVFNIVGFKDAIETWMLRQCVCSDNVFRGGLCLSLA